MKTKIGIPIGLALVMFLGVFTAMLAFGDNGSCWSQLSRPAGPPAVQAATSMMSLWGDRRQRSFNPDKQ